MPVGPRGWSEREQQQWLGRMQGRTIHAVEKLWPLSLLQRRCGEAGAVALTYVRPKMSTGRWRTISALMRSMLRGSTQYLVVLLRGVEGAGAERGTRGNGRGGKSKRERRRRPQRER